MYSNNIPNSTEVFDIVTSTSGITINFIVLCHFYALLKQWVSEESLGPNIITVNQNTDINNNSKTSFIFLTADCRFYDTLTSHGYGQCAITAAIEDTTMTEIWMRCCCSQTVFGFSS